jgi:hypothetical protein
MYNVMGRFTEQFSESQSGYGASFTVSECRNKLFEEGYMEEFLKIFMRF